MTDTVAKLSGYLLKSIMKSVGLLKKMKARLGKLQPAKVKIFPSVV